MTPYSRIAAESTSVSRMEVTMNGTSSGTYSRCPEERSSTTTTGIPSRWNARTTCEPMYPAPPVTSQHCSFRVCVMAPTYRCRWPRRRRYGRVGACARRTDRSDAGRRSLPRSRRGWNGAPPSGSRAAAGDPPRSSSTPTAGPPPTVARAGCGLSRGCWSCLRPTAAALRDDHAAGAATSRSPRPTSGCGSASVARSTAPAPSRVAISTCAWTWTCLPAGTRSRWRSRAGPHRGVVTSTSSILRSGGAWSPTSTTPSW